jgi:hypothetical protein
MSSKIGDGPEAVQRRMQLHSDFKLMELEREIRIGARISPKKVLDRLTTQALRAAYGRSSPLSQSPLYPPSYLESLDPQRRFNDTATYASRIGLSSMLRQTPLQASGACSRYLTSHLA